GWEDEQPVAVPASLQVDIRDVGDLPPNLAVVDVRAEAERAVVTLRNAGPARSGVVKSSVNGAQVSNTGFSAAADSTLDVVLPLRATTGVFTVSVDDPSGIPGDNSRHIILDPASRPRVLLVTGGGGSGFYLSRALAVAASEDKGFETRIVDGKALASMAADDVSQHAAMILLSTRGLDRRGREAIASFVRRGGGLFVVAADEVEPAVLSAMLEWQPTLTATEKPGDGAALSPTDLRHPIFRPFAVLAANLGQVQFARAWDVDEDGWDVAARFSNGNPALLERRGAAGRVVLFASDVDRRWNDFPLHPAFVPFAVESVRYLIGTHERPREYLVSQTPAGVPPVPGAIRVPPDNHPAVLNVDTRESNTARVTAAEFRAMLPRVEQPRAALAVARAEQDEARQSYWQYGLILMLAVLVLESFVGRV
ncbi:MAG TPA: hypothetical protein VG106_07415, partial [Vicinamibacterales bacterium]|nr:hypothetical protein [Vicinamibacterales bacterium]